MYSGQEWEEFGGFGSGIPLSAILATSTAASICLSRSVHHSSSSSSTAAAAAAFSSSSKLISSATLVNCQFPWIWSNLKCEDKIWSFNHFSRLRPGIILFSDYQSGKKNQTASLKWIWSNLKQSEIWRHNLKFFVPIWNQSETSLKPIWIRTNLKYSHIDHLK